jgi:hypothetical protein
LALFGISHWASNPHFSIANPQSPIPNGHPRQPKLALFDRTVSSRDSVAMGGLPATVKAQSTHSIGVCRMCLHFDHLSASVPGFGRCQITGSPFAPGNGQSRSFHSTSLNVTLFVHYYTNKTPVVEEKTGSRARKQGNSASCDGSCNAKDTTRAGGSGCRRPWFL